jgi:hypothetical protein
MANKEKEIDLKQRPEKISEEHLVAVQGLVNNVNRIQFNVGKVEAQKHNLLHELAVAQDQISILQDTLQKEYGSYDVNLSDGTISWPDEKNTNTPPAKNEK